MSVDDDPRQPVADTTVTAPEVEDDAAAPEIEQDEGDAAAETDAEGEPIEEGDGQPPKADGEPASDTVRRREQRQAAEERLKQQNERLRAENNQLRARTIGVRPEDVAAHVERIIGKPPNENDPQYRGDFLAYNEDMMAYKLERRMVTREVQQQVQTQEAMRVRQEDDLRQTFQERASEIADTIPDFRETIQGARNAHIEKHVEDLVYESPEGPRVSYYLAKNRDVLQSWNEMQPTQVARELGRLEARLSSPNPRTQTRAPVPIRPLTGGAAPPSQETALDAYMNRKYPGRNH